MYPRAPLLLLCWAYVLLARTYAEKGTILPLTGHSLAFASSGFLRHDAARRGEKHGLCLRMAAGKRSAISKAFKKPTGALTVSVEFDRKDSSKYSENDLTVLSMQLRKAKAAAVWTASLEDLAVLAAEQQSAKGNFPGPCPVIYYPHLGSPSEEQVEKAAETGACAVAVRWGAMDAALKTESCGLEVIWDVRSVEEIKQAAESGKGLNFLMNGGDAAEGGLMDALPNGAVAVSTVDCNNNEIVAGRDLARAGCKSLLVRQACVGDHSWDLRYAQFAIEGLISKANPNFQINDIGTSSKGSGGDPRQSYGADASGRAMQNAASVQHDIVAARGGTTDPFPNHPGNMPR